jgi:Putative peptidoglycan binding domain
VLYTPSPDYRSSLKHGMRGADVWALQINFPQLEEDGVFGDRVEEVVRRFQQANGLENDGIAGQATQQRLVLKRTLVPEGKHNLPSKLLFSIASNESGCIVGAYNGHADGNGFDLGPFQRNLTGADSRDEHHVHAAYSAAVQAELVAQKLVKLHQKYAHAPDSWYKETLAGGSDARLGWCLAVLDHNWPAAAENIAQIGRPYKTESDQDPQVWIEQASAGRLHTAREWIESYVERATTYVVWA